MSNKQLAGLNQASLKKRNDAIARTKKAIAILIKREQKITIRSVSREAQVSVSYIYKHPELAYKIQCLREQQKYDLVAHNQTTKKIDQQAELWRIEKAALKQENAELKAIIEQEKVRGNNTKELKSANLQLATENLRLKQELKYTLKSLQEAREFILEQRKLE
ncbi:MAG: hypothetical protein RLZZ381_2322 [Cyanobacteriota bacterium]|jgi:hypothetical protein